MELEETVSEFMNVAFTTRVNLSQLSEVRNSLIEAQRFIIQDEFHVDTLVMVRFLPFIFKVGGRLTLF
jgi:midasin